VALAPFLFPGAKALNVAAKTCVMILLAASYDLLLGYAGIVSFAHVMFFGVGAYGVGLMLYALGASWGALGLGLLPPPCYRWRWRWRSASSRSGCSRSSSPW
jgi:branched-chain amino acid transport system permease protein